MFITVYVTYYQPFDEAYRVPVDKHWHLNPMHIMFAVSDTLTVDLSNGGTLWTDEEGMRAVKRSELTAVVHTYNCGDV